ncbi:Peptidase S10, serine carboxypeptidase [Artemisia annua]|uniref:Peptidase S10, serine carboxypeptidase n=1 Tax=Artemisia annua TaxID=35608 RepID=A0A2U1MRX5_ARTAN|nr:Peptidase S10, serine carboxypeptidase [Artemisia annua]
MDTTNSLNPLCTHLILIHLFVASWILIASQTIVGTLPGYPGAEGYPGGRSSPSFGLALGDLVVSNILPSSLKCGPLNIRIGNFVNDVPELQLDPNSWTKLANIIFLDASTLTGYSYATTVEAAPSSDTLSASKTTEFIRKGYVVGNPLTNKIGDINSRFEFAYQMALISKELFEPEYYYAMLWANNKDVMKALNVRKGRVNESWLCNVDMVYSHGDRSMPLYEFNVLSSVVYHELLTKRKCRALIFSGDHDMTVPPVGTQEWIKSLNLTVTDSSWDAWYSNVQVAGFKSTYAHDNYSLVYATVKGGGHEAPAYKPKEYFDKVSRWFANKPI